MLTRSKSKQTPSNDEPKSDNNDQQQSHSQSKQIPSNEESKSNNNDQQQSHSKRHSKIVPFNVLPMIDDTFNWYYLSFNGLCQVMDIKTLHEPIYVSTRNEMFPKLLAQHTIELKQLTSIKLKGEKDKRKKKSKLSNIVADLRTTWIYFVKHHGFVSMWWLKIEPEGCETDIRNKIAGTKNPVNLAAIRAMLYPKLSNKLTPWIESVHKPLLQKALQATSSVAFLVTKSSPDLVERFFVACCTNVATINNYLKQNGGAIDSQEINNIMNQTKQISLILSLDRDKSKSNKTNNNQTNQNKLYINSTTNDHLNNNSNMLSHINNNNCNNNQTQIKINSLNHKNTLSTNSNDHINHQNTLLTNNDNISQPRRAITFVNKTSCCICKAQFSCTKLANSHYKKCRLKYLKSLMLSSAYWKEYQCSKSECLLKDEYYMDKCCHFCKYPQRQPYEEDGNNNINCPRCYDKKINKNDSKYTNIACGKLQVGFYFAGKRALCSYFGGRNKAPITCNWYCKLNDDGKADLTRNVN